MPGFREKYKALSQIWFADADELERRFLECIFAGSQIVQTCWRWMCWMQPDFDLLFGRMHVWFSSDSDFMFPTFLCCLVLCWVMYFVQRKQNISDYPVRWGPRKLPAARQRLLEQAAQQAEVEQGRQLET